MARRSSLSVTSHHLVLGHILYRHYLYVKRRLPSLRKSEVCLRRLKELRLAARYEQEDVAAAIGLHQGSISGYEHGQPPSLEVAVRLAEFFGVSLDYLLGRTDEGGPAAPDAQYREFLARRLKEAMAVAGLDAAELARDLGVPPDAAVRWAEGFVDLPTLLSIGRRLGKPLAWFVDATADGSLTRRTSEVEEELRTRLEGASPEAAQRLRLSKRLEEVPADRLDSAAELLRACRDADAETLNHLVRRARGEVVPGDVTALWDLLERLARNLPERDAQVLGMRLGLGKEKPRSLADIGRELGVTRERARQLVGRAMDALTSELARWIESRELR